jgi:hypothetical protein
LSSPLGIAPLARSIIVVEMSAETAAAATSRLTQPPPMMACRAPGRAGPSLLRASSRVRSSCAPLTASCAALWGRGRHLSPRRAGRTRPSVPSRERRCAGLGRSRPRRRFGESRCSAPRSSSQARAMRLSNLRTVTSTIERRVQGLELLGEQDVGSVKAPVAKRDHNHCSHVASQPPRSFVGR